MVDPVIPLTNASFAFLYSLVMEIERDKQRQAADHQPDHMGFDPDIHVIFILHCWLPRPL